MEVKQFLIVTLLFLMLTSLSAYAQKTANSLTLIYSNNINGEIDPCPT